MIWSRRGFIPKKNRNRRGRNPGSKPGVKTRAGPRTCVLEIKIVSDNRLSEKRPAENVPRRQTNICTGELRIVYLKRDLRKTCHVDPGMESKPDGSNPGRTPGKCHVDNITAGPKRRWKILELCSVAFVLQAPSRTASESGHGFLPVRGVRHLGSGAPEPFCCFFRHQRLPRQKTSAEGTGGSSDFCSLTSGAVFEMNICVFYVCCS